MDYKSLLRFFESRYVDAISAYTGYGTYTEEMDAYGTVIELLVDLIYGEE